MASALRHSSLVPFGRLRERDRLHTGIHGLALARGEVTELVGPAFSGKATVANHVLASAIANGETCAVIDTSHAWDAHAAAAAGIDLRQVLWVRCQQDPVKALKATDLLLRTGGFGVVVLDLGSVPLGWARRLPTSWWYRFQRAVEPQPTVLLVVATEPCAGPAAASRFGSELGTVEPGLIRQVHYRLRPQKPPAAVPLRFAARKVS